MEKVAGRPSDSKPIILPKNSREELRLSLAEFNGHPYVDLRVYYRDDESGEMRPSRSGITVSPTRWPAFMAGLQQLDEALEQCGLLPLEVR
ncbi:MAG: transcriptional coactivator p15/PC4 family protein [Candidatus Latescibacteria bacterium]|nr:transcriptional coactivator p15/PC4 family protein [Candidatus Latescibacterota bacterium]